MREQWSEAQAEGWYRLQPWLVGANFIPSTAINQLEMWQAETFDPAAIDRELGWAEDLGFNSMRVFLHDLLWQADAAGFKDRVRRYLDLAQGHRVRTLFVLFDDCWNKDPRLGKQQDPVPGVHNSGWLQSPGEAVVTDPADWPRLERYVKEVLAAFAADARIVLWDLYNEPGNSGLGARTMPLLREAFRWARAIAPSQPLTTAVYGNAELRQTQLDASDVVTFHHYGPAEELENEIRSLKACRRPLICTEYMARTRGSRFETHLPVFKRERVGCYNWGFVSGKTQTIYQWGTPAGASEPPLWFHDILRPDGSPFEKSETETIRRLTR
jgi:hypothetical protein